MIVEFYSILYQVLSIHVHGNFVITKNVYHPTNGGNSIDQIEPKQKTVFPSTNTFIEAHRNSTSAQTQFRSRHVSQMKISEIR